MSRVAGVLLLFGVPATAVWYFALRQPRNDLERFQGDWQLIDGERATPTVIRISGDRWQFTVPGAAGKAYTATLNEAANPKEIDLDPVDARFVGPPPKLHGVYAFEPDGAAKVRVNPGTEPRPKTLDDPEKPAWVLVKVKPEEKAEPKK